MVKYVQLAKRTRWVAQPRGGCLKWSGRIDAHIAAEPCTQRCRCKESGHGVDHLLIIGGIVGWIASIIM